MSGRQENRTKEKKWEKPVASSQERKKEGKEKLNELVEVKEDRAVE
jgi:hypothetical protein